MKKLALFTAIYLCAAPAFAVETAAKHAYLMDEATGAVLLNKEGEVAMVPSSMSKLMTAYIVFDRMKQGRLKMEDMLTVSEKAWRMQGSKTFVKVGEQVSVNDLIHGIIVQSGNDACIVMAEGIAGSEEAFVSEMNKIAERLGLSGSHFKNATGWPEEGHVMTARDLATLARRIIEDFPEYYPLYSTKEYTFNNIKQHNRNRLLGNDIGVDGMKTGHTDAGGYGIVLSAKKDERRLILVINGLASDDDRVKEGDMLLRWGLREFTNKQLAAAGTTIARAPVFMGTAGDIPLVVEKDVVVTVPAGNDAAIKMVVRYDSPLPAPITKSTHIAELVVTAGDAEPQVVPLVAGEDVAKVSGFAKIWAVIKFYLSGMKG